MSIEKGPNLIDAGRALALAGCARVDVVPLFLGTGGHVRKDLPLLIETLRAAHPQTTWTVRASIGEAPGVVQAMADAALAGIAGIAGKAATTAGQGDAT